MENKKKISNEKPEDKVALNFRVSASFRKSFKMAAVESEINQTELLELVFNEWKEKHTKSC